MKIQKIKIFCKKGGEIYEEEIEEDETDVKFWCSKHKSKCYQVKDESNANN